jgi:preprotein translocase subunit SecG
MPKIKNIIIFIVIVAVLVLIYVFFIKPSSSSDQTNLISSSGTTTTATTSSGDVNGASSVAQDFLTTLLGVKNIQLNTDIFSNQAFTGLHDSSVTLTPDATTGRTNPFAPFGVGNIGMTLTATSTHP